MLTLVAGQAESLWDEALPAGVRELPSDLAALDRLLSDPDLLAPLARRFFRELAAGRAVVLDGRPTIAMETYVRLMVLNSATAGAIARWWRRSRTRSICGGSAGSRCQSGCRTSRRYASSRAGWGRIR